MYDVIIVGAGMAGLTAAIYAKRAGRSVLVLEDKIPGGQIVNALKVDNWPGQPGVSGADLMQKVYKQATELGAEIRYEEVVGVAGPAGLFPPAASSFGASRLKSSAGSLPSPSPATANFVIKTDEDEYMAKAVIIATGTEPRKLSAKQAKDAGKRLVSYCATCDGALYKNKPVVVVGSGNTAKHEARYLEKIASKVYHIHHNDPIPKDAEAVFVAIGRVPATLAFQGLVNLDTDGYVVAGEDGKTSRDGVFVAGDCRTKSVRQLVTAAADGAAAAGAAIDFLA